MQGWRNSALWNACPQPAPWPAPSQPSQTPGLPPQHPNGPSTGRAVASGSRSWQPVWPLQPVAITSVPSPSGLLSFPSQMILKMTMLAGP
ncbi:Disintegrin and metalloproteinase domain-containing protein 29 [Manis javanica]|nr:Disintegrin and metalloproteinase domain-containing protein 29 [Manis javanica]